MILREGEPCSHKGCLNHISHPCEKCGRIGGKYATQEQIIEEPEPIKVYNSGTNTEEIYFVNGDILYKHLK